MSTSPTNQDERAMKAALALLDYHQRAMESRRSVGFKAFLALAGFDILLLKGICDMRPAIENWELFRFLVVIGYWSFLALYFFFMLNIELANRFNRLKYIQLEETVFRHTGLEPDLGGPPRPRYGEGCWKTLIVSWAGTWPVLAIALITLICSLAVYQLRSDDRVKDHRVCAGGDLSRESSKSSRA
jgi:hypothetical protein